MPFFKGSYKNNGLPCDNPLCLRHLTVDVKVDYCLSIIKWKLKKVCLCFPECQRLACSDYCGVDATNTVICFCRKGYILGSDNVTCMPLGKTDFCSFIFHVSWNTAVICIFSKPEGKI